MNQLLKLLAGGNRYRIRYATPSVPDPSEFMLTDEGYMLRTTHPRVVCDSDHLAVVIDRMYGANARAPYSTWFNYLKSREDSFQDINMVGLALVYLATRDETYKSRFLARFPTGGTRGWAFEEEMYALDLMWNEIDDTLKLATMDRVAAAGEHCFYYYSTASSNSVPPYSNVRWYHYGGGEAQAALPYAGVFAYTSLELNKNPVTHPYNANNFVAIVKKEMTEEENGYLYRIERRLGGDTTYHTALAGDYGGLNDNHGYEYNLHSTIELLNTMFYLTGYNRKDEWLRDKYRAQFWQNTRHPNGLTSLIPWDGAGGGITGTNLNNTIRQRCHLLVHLFKDGRASSFINPNAVPTATDITTYLYLYLLFYDDSVVPIPHTDNPHARYMPGSGYMVAREDWTTDAAYVRLLAGEGISRRYEDSNCIALGRKGVTIVTAAGARMTHCTSGTPSAFHYWYSMRSTSRNTLRIDDPDETWDINNDATTKDLHTGDVYPSSYNFGGQINESFKAISGSYLNGTNAAFDFPLGFKEMANVIKYEHESDSGYTYTVAEAEKSYTKKITQFERELVFVRPDVIIVFDRVNAVNAAYKKTWMIHTIDEPVIAGTPDATAWGMKSYNNASETVIDQAPRSVDNITYLTTLLPASNKIVIRGGDTTLVDAKPLNSTTPVELVDIDEPTLDMARFIRVEISGGTNLGTLTIRGTTDKEVDTTERVRFSSTWPTHKIIGTYNKWLSITGVTTTDLDTTVTLKASHYHDTEQVDGTLRSFAPAPGPTDWHTTTTYDITYGVVITAGSDPPTSTNPLTVTSEGSGVDLDVQFSLGTSYLAHTLRVTGRYTNALGYADVYLWDYDASPPAWVLITDATNRIEYSTSDATIDYHIPPQYQDFTTGVVKVRYVSSRVDSGDAIIISTHSVLGINPGAVGHREAELGDNLGHWTMNVEAATPATFDNFLNVFCLKDQLDAQPAVSLITNELGGDAASVALIDNYFVLFGNTGVDLASTSITLPVGTYTGLICNLAASTNYWWKVTGLVFEISNADNGGTQVTSSSMGLIKITGIVATE